MSGKSTADKKLRITVFLIKEGAKAISDFLETAGLEKVDVPNGASSGALYHKAGFAKAPPWVSLFSEVAGFNYAKMRNSSCRAVYVVMAKNRWFCFTFGYTRHLIREAAVERNFGLKVALNLGHPDTIKGIDKINISHGGLQSKEQAGRDVDFRGFEFDQDIDILKSMTAKSPFDEDEEQDTFSGRDSVSIYTRTSLIELPPLAQKLLKAYESTAYRKHYPWIDKITEERDVAVIAQLDDLLVKAINDDDHGRIWLAIPEIIPWEKIENFAYERQSSNPKKASPGLYPDIDLTSWLEATGVQGRVTRTILGNRKVYLRHHDGSPPDTWTVYRCLNAEVDLEEKKYILNDGDWYNVDKDFVKQVDTYYQQIPASTLQLPPFGTATEPEYLKTIPGKCPNIALMDCKLCKVGPGRGRVEFCDLFSNNREIIHVKQYGGSSLLSHLFSQAIVSGECFLFMDSFREEVNGHLAPAFRLADCQAQPNTSDYTICLAIMSKVPGPMELPFFSKVSLRHTVQELLKMRYKVTTLKIERDAV